MKKSLIGLLAAFIILAPGCERHKVKTSLQKMESEAIVFPDNLICIMDGEDVEPIIPPYPSTLVIYADSTECSKCRISNYFKYSDLMAHGKATRRYSVLFLISPPQSDRDPLLEYIRVLGLEYPIYIDYNNEFMKLNAHVPENSRFHTFMVDDQGKVLLVGDPVANSEIMPLFEKLTNDTKN
ncbi:MAG: hypothetical protein MJZ04_04015 [Bacteroidales bacterium]|nr:hypothetical protein [Candidatus Cryptobacteroides onthequi]MCQ2164330.1 hypothetical protein [Bacteroidales bacterium]